MTTRLFKFCFIVSSALLAVGCTIAPLSHEGLAEHQASRSGTINVAEKAEGLDGSKVGWGRITPFAIPIVPIYVQGDESLDLMTNIQEALVLAGYTPHSVVEDRVAADEATGPTLQASVTKKRYSNYTYFAPLIPTWGGMEVTLRLVDAGNVIWSDDFQGGGFTMNFFDGYNIASRESMTELLDAMVIAFDSDEFYSAAKNMEPEQPREQTADVGRNESGTR